MKRDILFQQRIGTYIHRDGRTVDMRRGIMRSEAGPNKTTPVYYYVMKKRSVIVSADELRNDWISKYGNHVFGTAASYQQDWLGFRGYFEDVTWEAWEKKSNGIRNRKQGKQDKNSAMVTEEHDG